MKDINQTEENPFDTGDFFKKHPVVTRRLQHFHLEKNPWIKNTLTRMTMEHPSWRCISYWTNRDFSWADQPTPPPRNIGVFLAGLVKGSQGLQHRGKFPLLRGGPILRPLKVGLCLLGVQNRVAHGRVRSLGRLCRGPWWWRGLRQCHGSSASSEGGNLLLRRHSSGKAIETCHKNQLKRRVWNFKNVSPQTKHPWNFSCLLMKNQQP